MSYQAIKTPENTVPKKQSLTELPKGFTLIELMVVVAIVAILLAVVAPSFTRSIMRGCITNTANDLVSAVGTAHSEALKSRRTVTVVANPTWNDGMEIKDNTAAVIQTFSTSCGGRLNVTSVPDLGGTPANPANFTFNGSGRLTTALTFTVCSTDTAVLGRSVVFSIIGRARSENVSCKATP